MRVAEEQRLREKTNALVLNWAKDQEPPFNGETAEDFSDAIAAAHVVADEARLGLHRWVDAARRTGISWSEVGKVLGISKQAAQQRFRSLGEADDIQIREDEEVVRLGATAFNEMRMLRDEGVRGNELIRTGAFTLVFRRSDRPWEYRRRIGATAMIAEMEEAGWSYVSNWPPFHYFKRPLAPDE